MYLLYLIGMLQKKEMSKTVIDKYPLSLIEVGFIKCIFPKAKFILSIRHPCDVVISCYSSAFKINDAMINFLDWNDTINFYKETFTLFEFYTNQFKIDYHIIKYENIVQNFKFEITKLLSYLKLNYEKNLENFFITAQNRSKISTPSYTQVINPLYHSSINRWKNYKNKKNSHQELSKWIKKFNY